MLVLREYKDMRIDRNDPVEGIIQGQQTVPHTDILSVQDDLLREAAVAAVTGDPNGEPMASESPMNDSSTSLTR
jgi:hypothetical protein